MSSCRNEFKKVTWWFVCACVRSSVWSAPFSLLWPAFTLTVHINALCNESVYRQVQHTSGIYELGSGYVQGLIGVQG